MLSSATTFSMAKTKAMTLTDLEHMAELVRRMPPEPIGEWMRQQNKPPELWIVVLPKKICDGVQAPAFWPSYVEFSQMIDKPVFILKQLAMRKNVLKAPCR